MFAGEVIIIKVDKEGHVHIDFPVTTDCDEKVEETLKRLKNLGVEMNEEELIKKGEIVEEQERVSI